MKEIKLTQGKVALVDDEDFERLNAFKWFAVKDKNGVFYAARTKRSLRMHREILNAPEGIEVDHQNGNGLDNQKENLRPATRLQNRRNSRKRLACVSDYKGVTRKRSHRKWQARIYIGGKEMHLGYFDCEVEAARAYDLVAFRHFGAFARLNFP